MSGKLNDITGKRFGRLVVLSFDKIIRKTSYWNCLCDCGKIKSIRGCSLVTGSTKSCSCLKMELLKQQAKKQFKTHGMSRSPTYRTWIQMFTRCRAKTGHWFKYYYKSGIKVCKRWLKFKNFFADMGEKPIGLTLERMNNKKGYCKENCCWGTKIQQARNKRNNHNITFQGVTKCLAEWTEILNFSKGTIPGRLKKGWTIEAALTTPIKRKK